MGTYTTNYNLFMPSIGEQGWGDLVNGNFSTIDSTMKGLNTWMETLETEGDAVAARVGTLEGKVSAIDSNNNFNGKINVNSVSVDTNNIVICKVSGVANNDFGVISTSTVNKTISPCTSATVTRYNTNIINCTLSNSELIASAKKATCTITGSNASSASYAGTLHVKVTEVSTGTVVLADSGIKIPKGTSKTWTFTRDLSKTYTVTMYVEGTGTYITCSAKTDDSLVYAT